MIKTDTFKQRILGVFSVVSQKLSNPKRKATALVALFAAIGVIALVFTHAATIATSLEAESGTLDALGCADRVVGASASAGSYIKFGCTSTATSGPGAHLPINYDLSTLTGTVRYVATNGSDSAAGTSTAPFATLAKAYSSSSANDTIVVREGTYRQGNLTTSSKSVRIIAYPGEVPTFNGAQTLPDGWLSEGSLQYHSYTQPTPGDGSGITFSTGVNLNDPMGYYQDQVWVGNTQLKQVATKAEVTDGRFYVENSANKRVYLSSSDVAKGAIEATQKDLFMTINAPGMVVEGIQVARFSNSGAQGGVISVATDNTTLRNVEIYDSAFIGLLYNGSSRIISNNLAKNITVSSSNWMGVSDFFTDYLTLDSVKLTNMNQFNEFTFSPQSGGIKANRTWYTKVINSQVNDNKSHGIWFDQSNYKIEIANNVVTNNAGTGVFYEISDDVLIANNYISTGPNGDRAVKLAGSSGLKLVNNTIIGGADPVGIYTDSRSMPGCVLSTANCGRASTYKSERDDRRQRPVTMDWMPRLDILLNNIIVYQTKSGYCGGTDALCITDKNTDALVPIETVLHQADTSRGIPQTWMDGNVYANGTGVIIRTTSNTGVYTTLSSFTNAMASLPVSIPGLDASSRYGNTWVNSDGSPTSALSSVHNSAVAVPNNATINKYIPAGSRHYGVLSK